MLKDHASYIRPSSQDEIYTKKLNDILVQIKLLVYYGTVFITSAEYCCKMCQCRIKLHQDERWYCLRCVVLGGAASPRWSETTRERVESIMAGYPEPEECTPVCAKPEPRRGMTTYNAAFGSRVEEARQALGLTQQELAAKVVKKDGNCIAPSTVKGIEKGHQNPSLYVREQLENILGIKGGICDTWNN